MSAQMTPEFLTVRGADLLHRALDDHGDPDLLRRWLAMGVDVNDKRLSEPQGLGLFPYGSPILTIACSRATDNHLAMTKLLLDAGANPRLHVTHKGYTPLMLAMTQTGNLKVLEWLVKAGDDINAQTQDGWRAIHSAATNNRVDALELLHGRGVDMDARFKGGTVLHLACDNVLTTEWLVKRAPHLVNIQDDSHQTALSLAIAGRELGVVQALVQAGADTQQRIPNSGKEYNALELAQSMRRFEMAEWLQAWDSAQAASQVIKQIRSNAPWSAPA